MKASIAYLVAPLCAYIVAHMTKYALAGSRRSWRTFFESGGMPSSHTAVVVALSTVVYAHQGFSELFAVVAVFAGITIYDAMGVRRSVGEQGKALLRLLEKSPFANDPLPRAALGHEPREVLAGFGIGVLVGLIVAIFITI